MALINLLLAATLAAGPTAQQAAEAAGRNHLLQLIAALRASPTPRDQALFSQLHDIQTISDPKEKAWRGAALRRAAEQAPNDRLVQWFWAIADEDRSGCSASSPCPERRMALARLEPENAAAWMPAGADAWQRRDTDEMDRLIGKMAKATFSDEMFVEATMAWNEVYARYPYPAATVAAWRAAAKEATGVAPDIDPDIAAMMSSVAMSAAIAQPSVSVHRACDRAKNPEAAAERFQDCARLGRVMVSGGRTMMSSLMGFSLLRRSETATQSDFEATRANRWRREQSTNLSVKFETDATAFRAYFVDLESTGSELRAQELQLQRAGISLLPPEGWMPADLASLKPAS